MPSMPTPPPFRGALSSQPSQPLSSLRHLHPAGHAAHPPRPRSPSPFVPPERSRTYPDFTLDEARLHPRKYSGYRVFSRWMASDQAFFVVRRFGTLNTRILLAMQDEIAALEEHLNFMDEEYSRKDYTDAVDNGTFRDEAFSDRRDLIQRVLPEKLAKYNSFVNSYSQLLGRPPVRRDDIDNVKRWLSPLIPSSIDDIEKSPHKYLGPIDELEAAFIDHHDDLIAVQPKSRSWFRNVLERSLVLKMPVIRGIFERMPEEYDTINTNIPTIWQNDKRVEGLSTGLIAVVGLFMLIGPLWLLGIYDTNPWQVRLGIITGFIILFFVLVAVATTARVIDALAAAAAYSAVLMVFMQLGPPIYSGP